MYLQQYIPLYLSPAELRAHQGKHGIDVHSKLPPSLNPLVTVKGSEKQVPHFTCMIWLLHQLINILAIHVSTFRLLSFYSRTAG